jgi:hypothetical protein
MKVNRIYSRDVTYPYKFRVEFSEKNININEILDWSKKTKVSCLHIPGIMYFAEESDAAFFILSFS